MDKDSQAGAAPSDDGNPSAQFRYRFADADFDEATGVLTVSGQPVALEPRPTRLLVELLRHAGEVVTKEELLDTVWEGRPTVDNVVANAVTKLRRALGDQAGARVTNQPRIGYRLLGPIERVAVGRLPDSAELKLKPGQPVPHRDGYRLERALGSSGRQHVWLARHSKLGHERVFKFAVDAERLRSLKREFTLYRVLSKELGDRPCFSTVVDANFAEAPYFLECQYGGPDLLSWAEEGDRLKSLSVEDRLALFLQVAQAIAAAHSVGVLHKDIKPVNVLVSGEPGAWVLKVTDFGSGQVDNPHRLKDLGLTAMGLTVGVAAPSDSTAGTLMYMAPEVMAGQSATVQSDVYALGVMLFQMVAGDLRRPLGTGWQRDVGDEVLQSDIEAATEGELNSRITSAAELVNRLLQIASRKEELSHRIRDAQHAAQSFAQAAHARARRPFLIAAFLALAIGLASSLLLYGKAVTASRLAANEVLRARAMNDFLNKDVLQAADVNRAANVNETSMRDVLDRASKRASERFKEQPLTESSVRRQLGEVFYGLAQFSKAEPEFSKSILLLESRVQASDPELLYARFGLVRAMSSNYRHVEAESLLTATEQTAGATVLSGDSELAIVGLRARLDWMMASQRNREAIPLAQRLITLSERAAVVDLTSQFEAKQRLGEIYLRLEDQANADAALADLFKPPFDALSVGEVAYARGRIDLAKFLLLKATSEDTLRAHSILLDVRTKLTAALGPKTVQIGHVNYLLADISSVRLKVEQIQLVSDGWRFGLGSIGLQGA
jgi:eukaryotic-like serine/threonine-protein kinase